MTRTHLQLLALAAGIAFFVWFTREPTFHGQTIVYGPETWHAQKLGAKWVSITLECDKRVEHGWCKPGLQLVASNGIHCSGLYYVGSDRISVTPDWGMDRTCASLLVFPIKRKS